MGLEIKNNIYKRQQRHSEMSTAHNKRIRFNTLGCPAQAFAEKVESNHPRKQIYRKREFIHTPVSQIGENQHQDCHHSNRFQQSPDKPQVFIAIHNFELTFCKFENDSSVDENIPEKAASFFYDVFKQLIMI